MASRCPLVNSHIACQSLHMTKLARFDNNMINEPVGALDYSTPCYAHCQYFGALMVFGAG